MWSPLRVKHVRGRRTTLPALRPAKGRGLRLLGGNWRSGSSLWRSLRGRSARSAWRPAAAFRHPSALFLLGLACLAWSAHEFAFFEMPMPQLHRQVPRRWMGALPWNWVGIRLRPATGIGSRHKDHCHYYLFGVCAGAAFGIATGRGHNRDAFGFARSQMPLWTGRRIRSPQESMALAESLATR